MTDSIGHTGTVTAIKGDKIVVEIAVSSACSTCHAKSVCAGTDQQRRRIEAIPVPQNAFQVGDTACVKMQASLGKKAILLAYVFPFMVLLGNFIAAYSFFSNELLCVGITIGAVVLYYLLLWAFSKKIAKEFIFYAYKN